MRIALLTVNLETQFSIAYSAAGRPAPLDLRSSVGGGACFRYTAGMSYKHRTTGQPRVVNFDHLSQVAAMG